jgi:hypothetical protein
MIYVRRSLPVVAANNAKPPCGKGWGVVCRKPTFEKSALSFAKPFPSPMRHFEEESPGSVDQRKH